jgi:hypothetical protein
MTRGRRSAAYSWDRRQGSWLVATPRRRAAVDALARLCDWGDRAAWAAAALSVPLFLYAVLYAFPNARLTALQQEREAIEQESRAFCEKHGMRFGTLEHTICAQDLTDVRANERQRTLDRLGMI